MPNKKIMCLTDIDLSGSGYFYLSTPILTGLANMGYEIKVAGLSYTGAEHQFPFSVIPCRELQDAVAVITNLNFVWNWDVLIVALDLPLQIQLFQQFQQLKKKYIAITPLENGPLSPSLAAGIFNMDGIFFISELGKQEAIKAGIAKAEHLYVGVDQELWHPATADEKKTLRKGLGIGEDEFVILTVADNQERKNLSSGMESISMLKKETDKKIRYLLVTREHSSFGWNLRDMATNLDINQEVNIFNRGIPQKDLWGLYAVSDVYLQPSKAEGLGIPVLDAMACNIPVVATDTGALTELLFDGRGHLIPPEYTIDRDVWGNARRHFIDRTETTKTLRAIMETNCVHIDVALKYAQSRTLDIPVKQVADKIESLFEEIK